MGKIRLEVSRMRGRHISKDWYFVWAFTLFIGGLIFYIGYISAGADISLEKPQTQKNEPAQAVTAVPSPQPEDKASNKGVTDSTAQSPDSTGQQDLEKGLQLVLGQGNSSRGPLKVQDFPSPVHSELIRGIGNYYSEVYQGYIFHAGLDYALNEGTIVRATQGGKIIFAGEDPILGKKVTIDCGEGWLVTYGGLDNFRVKEGETIEEQTALGQIRYFPGGEGENKRPQLHYEVWHNGEVQQVEP